MPLLYPTFTIYVKLNLFDIMVKFCGDSFIDRQDMCWNALHWISWRFSPNSSFGGIKGGPLALSTCPSNLVFVVTCHMDERFVRIHTHRHTLKWFYICPMLWIALDRQQSKYVKKTGHLYSALLWVQSTKLSTAPVNRITQSYLPTTCLSTYGMRHPSFTSQLQRITTLWPVLISHPV